MDRRQVIALLSLGVVGGGVGLVLTSGDGENATAPAPAADEPDPPPTLDVELPNRGKHPPLTDLDGWLQTDLTSLEQLEGKVVAVQFWTFGCSNCTATIPHLRALYEKYGRDDFEIVGVHAAEFDRERDTDAIQQAAIDLGVTWPIAIDHDKTNFRAWQEDRRFWPRLYILDRSGNIRYDHIGEGRYDRHDAVVEALIRGA